MTKSGLDIIIGPIENYEDGLFNARAAFEKIQKEMAIVGDDLKSDLDRLSKKGIPVDVIFEQGTTVIGLN